MQQSKFYYVSNSSHYNHHDKLWSKHYYSLLYRFFLNSPYIQKRRGGENTIKLFLDLYTREY